MMIFNELPLENSVQNCFSIIFKLTFLIKKQSIYFFPFIKQTRNVATSPISSSLFTFMTGPLRQQNYHYADRLS